MIKDILIVIVGMILVGVCAIRIFFYLFVLLIHSDNVKFNGNISDSFFLPIIVLLLIKNLDDK